MILLLPGCADRHMNIFRGDAGVEYIRQSHARHIDVICSGGMVVKNARQSEADGLIQRIRGRLRRYGVDFDETGTRSTNTDTQIVLHADQKATNTHENILNALNIIDQEELTSPNLSIISNEFHLDRIARTVWHIGRKTEYQHITWLHIEHISAESLISESHQRVMNHPAWQHRIQKAYTRERVAKTIHYHDLRGWLEKCLWSIPSEK